MKILFLDDHHLERPVNAEIVFHRPVKDDKPVILPDRPWEVHHLNWLLGAPSWNAQKKRWQAWYGTRWNLHSLYAESHDGLAWEKPDLGLVEYGGSRANNIINIGFEAAFDKERRLVILRDDGDPDPAGRYKALTRMGQRPEAFLSALISPDGLRWTPVPGAAIPSGDEYRLGRDDLRGRFLATGKIEIGEERTVSLSLSDDFLSWSDPQMVFRADETDLENGRRRIGEALADPLRRHPLHIDPAMFFTDVYNMPVFTRGDLYLGLPSMFHWSGAHPGGNQDGLMCPELAVSRDLFSWERPCREPFIPLSRVDEEPRCDFGMIAAGVPAVRGGELWFYYMGYRFSHLSPSLCEPLRASPGEPVSALHLARLRLDGFASARAGDRPGTVLTKPLAVTGDDLVVNLDARNGFLSAALLDPGTGRPLPGFAESDCLPLSGDGIEMPVRWKTGRPGSLGRRPARISFTFRNADLYAFDFT